MATAKEMLMAELQRRQAQEQSDQGKIRGDIESQRAMAEIEPMYRRSMAGTAIMQDLDSGTNKFTQAERETRPETTEVALRRAFQAQAATPKQNLLGYLQQQMGQDNREAKMANDFAIANAKGSKAKALSGEDRKRLGSARLAMGGLQDIKSALAGGDSILPEFSTGVLGDNKFTEARRRAVEGIGRMQSGGAINSEESKRFMQLMPRFQDSDEIRAKKLQVLETEISARMAELGMDGNSYGGQQQAPQNFDLTDMSDGGGLKQMSDEEISARMRQLDSVLK